MATPAGLRRYRESWANAPRQIVHYAPADKKARWGRRPERTPLFGGGDVDRLPRRPSRTQRRMQSPRAIARAVRKYYLSRERSEPRGCGGRGAPVDEGRARERAGRVGSEVWQLERGRGGNRSDARRGATRNRGRGAANCGPQRTRPRHHDSSHTERPQRAANDCAPRVCCFAIEDKRWCSVRSALITIFCRRAHTRRMPAPERSEGSTQRTKVVYVYQSTILGRNPK